MTKSVSHLQCPVVVLTFTQEQILGDELADVLRDQLLAVAVQSQARNAILDFQHVKFQDVRDAPFKPRELRARGFVLVIE